MAPKKGKTKNAAKGKVKQGNPDKVKVDKTFGLKNKKGKKASTLIRCAKGAQNNSRQYEEEQKRKKELDRARSRETARKEQTAQEEKAKQEREEAMKEEAARKKETLCARFKEGTCDKGSACEYLHDWKVAGIAEKINVYVDPRDDKENCPANNAKVCLNFLEAVKRKKYGFFWVCPNRGNGCQYKHAVPVGYLLEEPRKAEVEDDTAKKEVQIDRERNELLIEGGDLTAITNESFVRWAEDRGRAGESSQGDGAVALEGGSRKIRKISGKKFFLDGAAKRVSGPCDGDDGEGTNLEDVADESLFLQDDLVPEDLDLEELNF